MWFADFCLQRAYSEEERGKADFIHMLVREIAQSCITSKLGLRVGERYVGRERHADGQSKGGMREKYVLSRTLFRHVPFAGGKEIVLRKDDMIAREDVFAKYLDEKNELHVEAVLELESIWVSLDQPRGKLSGNVPFPLYSVLEAVLKMHDLALWQVHPAQSFWTLTFF